MNVKQSKICKANTLNRVGSLRVEIVEKFLGFGRETVDERGVGNGGGRKGREEGDKKEGGIGGIWWKMSRGRRKNKRKGLRRRR